MMSHLCIKGNEKADSSASKATMVDTGAMDTADNLEAIMDTVSWVPQLGVVWDYPGKERFLESR